MNSFTAPGQTVTVNTTAYADSMIWTNLGGNLPVFADPTGQALNLYSNLQLMPGMTASGSFALNYLSNNINSAPASWPNSYH